MRNLKIDKQITGKNRSRRVDKITEETRTLLYKTRKII